LLAENVSKQPQQADGKIHEDQLINFLVKRVGKEIAPTLAENAELNKTSTSTPVSTLCERSDEVPHEKLGSLPSPH